MNTKVSDPLDMNNYRVEKLQKMEKSRFEKLMMYVGGPLAIVAFVLIYGFGHFGFIEGITEQSVTGKALSRLQELGLPGFIRANYAMLAIFTAGLILWITEAIPNYLTSLVIILAVVLCKVTTQNVAFAQLGHPVMWLNILSFVLASMLVKTRFAKRLSLWMVLRFGKTAKGILWSFLLINLILSMFISATTVKAMILLPVFMVVCAVYGASNGKRNNFGRNLVIQNLFQVNIGANAFYTGSGAHLLAVSLIFGASATSEFGYTDWLISCGPMSLLILVLGLLMGTYVFFPMKKEETVPQIEGGMDRLKTELDAMGKMSREEWKAVAIFMGVLILWCTDSLHGIDATTVAFIGAVIALIPGIGVVKWNDVDIPWHLMLFSAGAYTLGAGLDATGLPGTLVNTAFDSLGITNDTPFWVLYVILTFLMMFSGLVFQSKTIRTMIFVPIAMGVAQRFGYPVISLAIPVAMLIEHVYVLPFNSKPALLLYNTNQYSMTDAFKFGIVMMTLSWVIILFWGETVLRWLGITPGVFFIS
ncbi:MAG: SLC13 family permease [Candidatus Cryptobacteroides sp.]|jgi:sodium-dependent dicarboxylate transporter 2/3/5